MRNHALTMCLLTTVACLGCSSLGFSSYPVAHFMTEQTKEVLEASPTMPAVSRELAMEVTPAHYLEPGDELLLELIDGESDIRLPADQQIAADGSIDLGEFGRVVVATHTLEQAEQLVQQTISATTNVEGAVNIRLIQPGLRYYVIGEVNSPGAYPLTGNETVLDGIMAAGGLTSRASACDLLLARPTTPCACRVTLPICYRAITQLGDTTTNYQLKPGDRIFVGRQTFVEEYLPCCSQKTCKRCCNRNTACCDPRAAERNVPNFVLPPSCVILPPPEMQRDATSSPSDQGEKSAQDGYSRWDEIRVAPWPDDEPFNRKSDPGTSGSSADKPARLPSEDDQPASSEPASRLDGELEFNGKGGNLGELLDEPDPQP